MRRPLGQRQMMQVDIDRESAEDPGSLDLSRLAEFADSNGSAGALTLTFSELEQVDKEIVSDPLVRNFIRHMFSEVPHMLYYLEGFSGTTQLFVACAYARDDQIVQTDQGIAIDMDGALAAILARRVAAAGLFAASRNESWIDVIHECAFPNGITDQAISQVRLRLAQA